VVDCESGAFTDTVNAQVVEADKAPFDLPDYWATIGHETGVDVDDADAYAVNESWNAALKKAIEEAQKGL
jgi:hypothetical protein